MTPALVTATQDAEETIDAQDQIEDQSDTDGDTLSDSYERELGTDPSMPDTDLDGLSDNRELRYQTDPLMEDTDGDSLLDGEEVDVYKTSPTNPDTDGDGFDDGLEVSKSSQELTEPDTALDGLLDSPQSTPEALIREDLPLPWPLAMPSDEQIMEARDCRVEALMAERYPDSVSTEELLVHFPVRTACDWAVLAFAYASRAESNKALLDDGQIALANALSQNAAYAFIDPLLFGYIEAPDIIAAPPSTQAPLTGITIDYEWDGLGDMVKYSISIDNVQEEPEVSGLINGEQYSANLSKETAQALGQSLTGLLPVKKLSEILVCYDNYPDWTIVLTYQNGTDIELQTNGSNVYGLGGPWWVSIGDQQYIQLSTTFVKSLADIVDELDLPVGQPAATYCFGLESSLLDILY